MSHVGKSCPKGFWDISIEDALKIAPNSLDSSRVDEFSLRSHLGKIYAAYCTGMEVLKACQILKAKKVVQEFVTLSNDREEYKGKGLFSNNFTIKLAQLRVLTGNCLFIGSLAVIEICECLMGMGCHAQEAPFSPFTFVKLQDNGEKIVSDSFCIPECIEGFNTILSSAKLWSDPILAESLMWGCINASISLAKHKNLRQESFPGRLHAWWMIEESESVVRIPPGTIGGLCQAFSGPEEIEVLKMIEKIPHINDDEKAKLLKLGIDLDVMPHKKIAQHAQITMQYYCG